MAEVLHLFISVAHRLPMREVDEVRAVPDKGLENCAHGRTGTPRQVLLMDVETLRELKVEPGAVKENITTRGLRLTEFARGQRLHVGEALLEVTIPCEPCRQMENIRPGLEQELRGRRGMLCRVLEGGLIRRGDRIEIAKPVPAETQPRRA